jgi:F-type H+-transporting ATPase subunit gamma
VATLRDIRRRIASVHSTRKITKAMEMVSAAKLRRNQGRIQSLRPYAGAMVEMMRDLATYAGETGSFPLLQQHPEERTVTLLVMTGDRGLAGAFNANVLRAATQARRELMAQGKQVQVLAVGRKGIGSLRFRHIEPEQEWAGLSDRPQYSDAQGMARRIIDAYVAHETDRVQLIYNHFTSPLEQKLMDVTILPIPKEAVTDGEQRRTVTYMFEPDVESIFKGLLPAYVEIAIYRALLESSASEQGARMTAMRHASDSAEEMLGTLTLALNRARQAAITQEILEVVAGADALG